MTKEIIIKTKLTADKGMVLTNGITYGTVIFLGDDDNSDSYYEITRDAYEAIAIKQNN